jgi:hypothetical protein
VAPVEDRSKKGTRVKSSKAPSGLKSKSLSLLFRVEIGIGKFDGVFFGLKAIGRSVAFRLQIVAFDAF